MKINYFHILSAFVLLSFSFFSCSINKGDVGVDFVAKDKENETAIQNYITKKSLTITKAASGMYYSVASKGGTRSVLKNETVSVHFGIYDLNDVLLDSSSVSLKQPYTFHQDSTFLTSIFSQPISVMKVGDVGTFLLPYRIAFGKNSFKTLPAYSPVKMVVTLVNTRNESELIRDFVKTNTLVPETVKSDSLRFILTKSVPGATALQKGKRINVIYSGKLLYKNLNNSGIFDDVFSSGSLTHTVGDSTTLIKGIYKAINKMHVGEKATVIFPSSLGYGSTGNGGSIPAYTPLYFDLEITSSN